MDDDGGVSRAGEAEGDANMPPPVVVMATTALRCGRGGTEGESDCRLCCCCDGGTGDEDGDVVLRLTNSCPLPPAA